ncbi:MAG TPA: redoxin domain-containing protein [Candidatus Tectomicrobia bacterium]|nr:redoxin domain-containing protein [Candidatus Tectomicrobia bacterium]
MGLVKTSMSGRFWWGVLLTGILSAAGMASALEVGDKAPDFSLPSTMGGMTSLSMFQGKKLVLIEFYGADFAPT